MTAVPIADANGIQVCYETYGTPTDPTLLLVMGLGAQMVAWQPEFCQDLVDQGYRVIRFDNRDAGLSTKSEGPPPAVGDLASLIVRGNRDGKAGYTLSDMADDAVAVLDAAGADQAHVVGASLGGMIAQTVAIDHPTRVLSLTSIMSKTGALFAGLPTPRTLRELLRERPADKSKALDTELARYELIAGPLFERDRMADFLKSAIERCYHPTGSFHQLAAMFASGDRTKALQSVTVPSLVIHGRHDRLVRPSGGHATAAALPSAELVIYNEMGHDLPPALWPRMTAAIGQVARRASEARPQMALV